MANNIPANIRKLMLSKIGYLPIIIKLEKSNITISEEIIMSAIELLNHETNKCLPQNCSHDGISKTKDGLDKELKLKLKTTFSYAKYVSDVLTEKGITEIIYVQSKYSHVKIKGIKLLDQWIW
ncbi:hypothetical protein [Treponema primitia]|uniref:hypothetical protein n=1 Tax=Treponema primitia TaxID=88058 RepID=UPI00025553BD|nr:hypothetical protein [Treponema primitia]